MISFCSIRSEFKQLISFLHQLVLYKNTSKGDLLTQLTVSGVQMGYGMQKNLCCIWSHSNLISYTRESSILNFD